MAAVCCASTSRWAIVWRRREKRLRSSRPSADVTAAGAVAGLGLVAGAGAGAARAAHPEHAVAPGSESGVGAACTACRAATIRTSSRVTRPPGPVPVTVLRST